VTQYVLHPDCRVRREEFGLLFYDLKGPKLLFVASGELLEPDAFTPGSASASSLAGRAHPEQRRIAGLLRTLVVKGFLLEQSLC
jgi:putative mycofactocin binding protein MftB